MRRCKHSPSNRNMNMPNDLKNLDTHEDLNTAPDRCKKKLCILPAKALPTTQAFAVCTCTERSRAQCATKNFSKMQNRSLLRTLLLLVVAVVGSPRRSMR